MEFSKVAFINRGKIGSNSGEQVHGFVNSRFSTISIRFAKEKIKFFFQPLSVFSADSPRRRQFRTNLIYH